MLLAGSVADGRSINVNPRPARSEPKAGATAKLGADESYTQADKRMDRQGAAA